MLERQMFMQHFEDYPWKITEIMQMQEMGAGHESLTPCLCFVSLLHRLGDCAALFIFLK